MGNDAKLSTRSATDSHESMNLEENSTSRRLRDLMSPASSGDSFADLRWPLLY
jgi:hypothetical protein